MKKLLLFLATILTITAKAQTSVYHPFPEDTTTWVTNFENNYCYGYCSSNFYEMEGDTIINSQSYNKIYMRSGTFYPSFSFSACRYTGAIRQDSINKKVYFIDSTMSTDTLLYDFNLTVGDTIQHWYQRGGTPFPLVVSGIDSLYINGNYRKVFNFQNVPGLIEGVGWTGDLLSGLLYSSDGVIVLACFNEQTMAGGPVPNECTIQLDCSISVGINEQNEKKHFSLFPNPFSDKLDVTFSNQVNSEIIIYDVTSRKLLQQKFINSILLNTEQLAKGLYLYEVKGNDGSCMKGKVVKD